MPPGGCCASSVKQARLVRESGDLLWMAVEEPWCEERQVLELDRPWKIEEAG